MLIVYEKIKGCVLPSFYGALVKHMS